MNLHFKNLIPHMMLQTQPKTKMAIDIWIKLIRRPIMNARTLFSPYPVAQPKRGQKEATSVPVPGRKKLRRQQGIPMKRGMFGIDFRKHPDSLSRLFDDSNECHRIGTSSLRGIPDPNRVTARTVWPAALNLFTCPDLCAVHVLQ